jgi:hypothetical protein
MAKSDVRAEASLDDETIARVEAESAERGTRISPWRRW